VAAAARSPGGAAAVSTAPARIRIGGGGGEERDKRQWRHLGKEDERRWQLGLEEE